MTKILSLLTSTYITFLIILCLGAYLIYIIQSPIPYATIKTYSDGLWWALNMASVGDASIAPVTNAGRLIGAGIIFFGYSLFAIIVASLSAAIQHWLKK